ncbi:MAG: hypothetical protein E7439_03855 [Ruminococcaceae bacterium]|nr:hypothetical protein [Oscillospiraceae bacterium]
MKKLALFLAFILLVGVFAGCKGAGEAGASRSIENADGTLSDWMKDEIYEAFAKDYFEEYGATPTKAQFGSWWDPQKPMSATMRYYGTYDGYVMYSQDTGMEAYQEKEIAGFLFVYASVHILKVYKDGEFYDLEELYNQGVIDDKAIEIAYNGYCRVEETIRRYRKENGI